MSTGDCIAMVLAGGSGERLGALTRYHAKPTVTFGTHDRIIDFTLKNCMRAGINTVGILSQYYFTELFDYVNDRYNHNGELNRWHMLPSRKEDGLYLTTADAVYKNIAFIDRFWPEHVLILASDHIYRMDYSELVAFHKAADADVTLASHTVAFNEASRLGILNADEQGLVYEFQEKPPMPKSNLASMGIYVFKWGTLRKYLLLDSLNENSSHDFGKDIMPMMLSSNERVYTYQFNDYWRDVGTLDSLWQANMDLLANPEAFLAGEDWQPKGKTGYFVTDGNKNDRSVIAKNCTVLGNVKHSVISSSATIEAGAEIVDSVLMPGAYIGENVRLDRVVVGAGAKIMDNVIIGSEKGTSAFLDHEICRKGVSLVAPWMVVPPCMCFKRNSHIYSERIQEWEETLCTAAMIDYFLKPVEKTKNCGA